MTVRYITLKFASRDHEKVSSHWYVLLHDLWFKDHVHFNVNEGHRTKERQAELIREKGLWSPSNPTGAAAVSDHAPHIRTGSAYHAIDFDNADAVIHAAAKRGVTLTRTIRTEPWHLEANAASLHRYFKRNAARVLAKTTAKKVVAVVRKPQPSRVSQKGLNLIAGFEGWVNHVYLDPVKIPTIGFGHVVRAGEHFPPTISLAIGRRLLRKDAASAEHAVRQGVKVKINQNQFDALVCFAFNVGNDALLRSTLLRELNRKHFIAAANQFLHWDKATENGVVRSLPGLTRRRQAERQLFLGR